MSEQERKTKAAAHKVEWRAQQKLAREAAAAAAAAEKEVTLQQFNEQLEAAYEEEHPDDPDGYKSMDECEWQGFRAWAATDDEQFTLDNCLEFYGEWSRPYGGQREEWERHASRMPPQPQTAVLAMRPAPPAPPDDDPDDDPYGGYSADCFYEGPNDHDIAEQRARQERLCRDQPGFVRLTLGLQPPCSVTARLHVVREDYNDGYEVDQERWYNEDARRAAFYGVPSGDLPPSAAAPFGWVPQCCQPAAESPAIPQPHREDVAVYGPLANNPEGDKAFRKDRALWYQSIKGERALTGTLAEQWEKADVLARSFRVDNTRSGRPAGRVRVPY